MEKTIRLSEDKNITLSNNAAWLYEYADQFGYDITPTLLPLANSIIESLRGVAPTLISELEKEEKSKNKKKKEEVDIFKIIRSVDFDALKDGIFELFTLRPTDFINLVWAMAKAADEDTPEPRIWIREIDPFPFDILVPEVIKLVISGFSSSKNWMRLQSIMTGLKTEALKAPSISKLLPSQESKEG